MSQEEMRTQRSRSKKMNRKSIDEIQEKLIQKDQAIDQRTKFEKFKEYWLGQIQTCNRTVYFNGEVSPQNHQNNLVKNTKYNIITFIPKVLYNQFKFFFNLFFLITALSQLIQVLRVGLFVTYMGPLAMVIGLTMGKQAYDDYNTYLRDIEANSKVYDVIKENQTIKVKSKDLKIGDIVILNKGDRVPADMVTLYSDNDQGSLFLKTDQLDGETDWKLRKAIKKTQLLITEPDHYSLLWDRQFKVQIKPPQSQIYNFSGVFMYGEVRQRLTLQNTMWTSTVLTNGTVIGLVMYVGRQTRISMGSSTARTKFGILDLEINLLSKILFLIMVLMTITFLILQGTEISYVPVQFMRVLILLSSIIPISMRVNLDFAKLFYSHGINNDKSIEGTIARNSTCPQELGRVRYILSDKTGTLTQNQMIFRRISIQDQMKFTDENSLEIKQMLQAYDDILDNINSKEKYIKNIITALALCHNVTPVFNQEKTEKSYQASSPDQITFVKIAEQFGLSILERTQNSIQIQIPSGKIVDYQILYAFPFKSETKRMGIIIRNTQTKKLTFYLKGADSVMKQFVLNRQKQGFIDQECKDLSMTGLRTLVITRKLLTEDFYNSWSKKYEQAYNRLEPNQQQIDGIMKELQRGVQFLGITGIQDKLQFQLKQTIQSLKSAKIKIWMITGDKIETAQCISRSCGLQGVTEQNFKIQEAGTPYLWKNKWEVAKTNLNKVLIIDGKTLLFVLENQQRSKDFFIHAMKMPSVICCRCSPQQKRTLTQGVKKYKNKKQSVLGIGDGGNDVGMIQAADVGVGIVGKQGKQAALAADFSILQFKNVQTLLLWHGRLSYKRSALLASFIIHRGFIVSVIQLIFSCVFFYVSIPVFNSYLSLGYATFFTFWPVFSLILDTDIDKQNAIKYPKLYDSLQQSNELSAVNFIAWIWKASFQGSVIMILTLVIFLEQSYLQIQTIGFTILILTEYFMTLSQINRIHVLTLACVGGSLVCYAICIIFLQDYVHVSQLSLQNFFFVCLITLVSWGPTFLWKLARKKIWPTDYQKVMITVKRKLFAKNLFRESGIQGFNQYDDYEKEKEIFDQKMIKE